MPLTDEERAKFQAYLAYKADECDALVVDLIARGKGFFANLAREKAKKYRDAEELLEKA